MKAISQAARGLFALGYPFLVFGGLAFVSARWMALLVGGSFLLRGLSLSRRAFRDGLLALGTPATLVGLTLAATIVSNDERVLRLTPAAVNVALLVSFGRTLHWGPTLVERLARLRVPDLPPEEVRYCRSVTVVWCCFFSLNAAFSIWLAYFASREVWALYTGFVAYVLVGLLFAAEFVIRSWRFGRYEGTPVEPLFRRIFPPPDTDETRAGEQTG